MKYEMIEDGTHEQDGKQYGKGDVIESREPLDQLYPQRFKRAGAGAAATVKAEPPSAGEGHEEGPTGKGPVQSPAQTPAKTQEESTLGEDVTEEFDSAAKAGLKVYRDGRHYKVAEDDAVNTQVDDGELTSKAKVEAFVKDYSKG